MAAVAANAATFSWKTSTTGKINGPGTGAVLASGTAYFFDSAVTDQTTLLAALIGGADIASQGALSYAAISSGAISATSFDVPAGYSSGDTFAGYLATVLVDGGQTYVYISPDASGATPATGSKSLSVNASSSKNAVTTFAPGEAITYSGSGWYTQSVPEPTSGVLLLLGMAGLALKRKRA